MNVLVFTTIFPSEREPIRGIYNLRRFQALAQHCDVRVVAPVSFHRRVFHPQEWFTTSETSVEGIRVTYPTNWALPRSSPAWYSRQMYQSVKRSVDKLYHQTPFDVILGAFAYPDVVVAAQLADHFQCPLVALVMGSDINHLAQRHALRDRIRKALNRADYVIAVSAALKTRVVELGVPADRIVVQHNGVDGSRFTIRERAVARGRLGIDNQKQLICFVGNLQVEKGPDLLIEAVARLHADDRRELEVIFVGDGNSREDLRTRADQLGLTRNIRLTGRRPHDEIPFWMAAADVVCLPSRREGCPNVVLEALACGRPVVATSVGGVPEVLSQSNGIIVPPDDPTALGAALSVAVKRHWDPSQLRASVESLTWEQFGRVLNEILRSSCEPLISRPPSAVVSESEEIVHRKSG